MIDKDPNNPLRDENDVEDLDDIMDYYNIKDRDLIELDNNGLFDDPENIDESYYLD